MLRRLAFGFCCALVYFATGVLQNGVTSGVWDEGGHTMAPEGPEHRAIVACVTGLVALATALWVLGRVRRRNAGGRLVDAFAEAAQFLACVCVLHGVVAVLAIARIDGPIDDSYRWFLAIDSAVVAAGSWLTWRMRSRLWHPVQRSSGGAA